jgi:hypothetical protein
LGADVSRCLACEQDNEKHLHPKLISTSKTIPVLFVIS